MEQHHNGKRNHKIIGRNEAIACGTFIPRETFMKLRISMLALLFALAMGTAFAHGNKVHVRGTVEKISADSVVVKTADGKSLEVKFAASTVFLSRANNEDKPAKAGDLAAGDLVVIHATSKDNILEADEIKFSVAAAAKRATPAPTKPKP
jgi:hypothetical protein